MTSNGFHYKGQGREVKSRHAKPTVELVGPRGDFKLTYRPIAELRQGLSGTSQMGFNPATGRTEQMGNPVMYPAGRFQTDVVLVEDALSGELLDVVDDQKSAHRVCQIVLKKRQPRPAPVAVVAR